MTDALLAALGLLPKDKQSQALLDALLGKSSQQDASSKVEKDIVCGGAVLAEILFACETIRKLRDHLNKDHNELFVSKRVENMIVDALGIEWRRFLAKTPDMCLCKDLKFTECRCPNFIEVDLVKSGRRMAALKTMKNRFKVENMDLIKRALDFYCPV